MLPQVDASKTIGSPSPTVAQKSPRWIPTAWAAADHSPVLSESHSDGINCYAPPILFRDEGIFAGVDFDDATMMELSNLLSVGNEHSFL